MSKSAPGLDQIQRWMQMVIVHPDGVVAGINSMAAREQIGIRADEVEQVISRSRALDSVQRLEVYGNAYTARLIECLAAEYPAVRAAVGEDAFSRFVCGYLQQYPSTSYTLADFGRAFPQFLAESRPPRSEGNPDWADTLVDLATLERTYNEVFDGPGEEQQPLLSEDDLRAIPPDRWGDVRLRPAASLRLLELRFPVHEFASAVRQGREAILPSAAETCLAISRRDYIVRRRALARFPFLLLRSVQQGQPLAKAIEAAVLADAAEVSDPRNLGDQIQIWFRVWTQDGYFVGVDG